MKILHTSDWHLGHRLLNNSQYEEQQLFLDWLLEIINKEKVDVLLMSGDVFDTANPTHQSLEQYYLFLTKLKDTCCQHAIITGGNHDSPGTLNAPQQLLKFLNISVIGKATEDVVDEIIVVKDKEGKDALAVGAVPFLRDQDIRMATLGESFEQAEMRYKAALIKHYAEVGEQLVPYKKQKLPVMAMGHLFATKGLSSDSEKDIYVGNLGNIGAKDFPSVFDYVALGHLHRPQMVDKNESIRYSGSPVALSFSEASDKKEVLILETKGDKVASIETVPVPEFRRLVKITGTQEEVKRQIETFSVAKGELTPWAEVTVKMDDYQPQISQQVFDWAEDRPIEVLKVQTSGLDKNRTIDEVFGNVASLDELTPEDIFLKKCEASSFNLKEQPEVLSAFREIVSSLGN